jgi:hypothetical protein
LCRTRRRPALKGQAKRFLAAPRRTSALPIAAALIGLAVGLTHLLRALAGSF